MAFLSSPAPWFRFCPMTPSEASLCSSVPRANPPHRVACAPGHQASQLTGSSCCEMRTERLVRAMAEQQVLALPHPGRTRGVLRRARCGFRGKGKSADRLRLQWGRSCCHAVFQELVCTCVRHTRGCVRTSLWLGGGRVYPLNSNKQALLQLCYK